MNPASLFGSRTPGNSNYATRLGRKRRQDESHSKALRAKPFMNEILLRASFWSAGRPRTTFRRELAFSNRRLIFERSMKDFRQIKQRGDKITALTAYDYPTARLLDESGIDIILVGDSVGMVVLGYPDTADVTLDEMLHHTRAAARGVKQALLVGDMPIHTYERRQSTLPENLSMPAQAVKPALG